MSRVTIFVVGLSDLFLLRAKLWSMSNIGRNHLEKIFFRGSYDGYMISLYRSDISKSVEQSERTGEKEETK